MSNASKTIDDYLTTLPKWQQVHLGVFRDLIHSVAPAVKEEWKWSVPIFSLDKKMVFAMSGFKAHTKYNFIGNGALLDDSEKLFNNGLESKKSRSIDLREGEAVDPVKLKQLIEQSINLLGQ